MARFPISALSVTQGMITLYYQPLEVLPVSEVEGTAMPEPMVAFVCIWHVRRQHRDPRLAAA